MNTLTTDPTIDPEAPRECDIVMKGGITSGIVYPKLVATLAEQYRFRSVGGTSAGAIAAAATAAAEFGRQHNNPAAFTTLQQLPELLAGPARHAKRSMLFNLFQCVPPLKRHYRVLVSALNAKGPVSRVLLAIAGLVLNFLDWAFLGSMLGLIPLAVLYWKFGLTAHSGPEQTLIIAWLLCIAVISALVSALLRFVFTAKTRLMQNNFGLCSGMPTAKANEGPAALTSWLHEYYQSLAGLPRTEPLTFGHLWTHTSRGSDGGVPQTRNIDLQMMTTALNLERPFAIPFRTHELFFDPVELGRLFPQEVMTHLTARTGPRMPASKPVTYGGKTLTRLPPAEDLPVLLGVRLSLCFPILLQAVPLYMVDYSLKCNNANADTHTASRILFSDGGLCSNFPLHFFDSLLPMRPTFAVDLTEFPPEHSDRIKDRVWLPKPNVPTHNYIPPLASDTSWRAFAGVFGAMIDSARGWRDSLQEGVPGYRERIVQVRLGPKEGGLNLDMPEDTIKAVSDAGSVAAHRLIDDFLNVPAAGAVQGWRAHEFIRLRSLLCVLQPNLRHLKDVVQARYAAVVRSVSAVYPFQPPAQQSAADTLLADLARVGSASVASGANLCAGAPRPAPDLEVAGRP